MIFFFSHISWLVKKLGSEHGVSHDMMPPEGGEKRVKDLLKGSTLGLCGARA